MRIWGAFVRIMGEACIRVSMRERRRVGGVYATLSPSEIGRYACRDVTAVYPGVAHSPAWRNQPRMSWGVTRRSASPTAS